MNRPGQAEGRRRRAREEEAAGVTVLLARAVRLAGASRSARAGGLQQNLAGVGRNQAYGPLIKSPVDDLPEDTQQDQSSAEREDSC